MVIGFNGGMGMGIGLEMGLEVENARGGTWLQ